MPSKIIIQFNSIPSVGETTTLKNGYTDNDLLETYQVVRTSAYNVTTQSVTTSQLRDNFRTSFFVDYNGSDLFTFDTTITGQLGIEHPNSGFFTNGEFVDGTSGAVTLVSIINTSDAVEISIDTADFSQAAIPCTDVSVDIITDVLAVIYRINGGADVVNAANPFSFEWIRGAYINIEVENVEGNTSNRNVQVPQSLSVSNTVISVVNSPSGATVTATVSEVINLDLEYSLDDITYQTENTFASIIAGSYTMYIKDQLGCSIEIPFTVDDFEDGGIGIQTALADLPSKSNSIRFAKRITWGDCSDYKNDENTLSCEQAHTKNPRQIYQLFQDCDTITTQIRSNYETITTTIIQEDGTETLVPVNQLTSNIGLKEMSYEMMWSEKYRPRTLDDILGHETSRFPHTNTPHAPLLVSNWDSSIVVEEWAHNRNKLLPPLSRQRNPDKRYLRHNRPATTIWHNRQNSLYSHIEPRTHPNAP